jgi:hypothetical protein
MKPIAFATDTAGTIYTEYMRRCEKALVLLSPADREDVLMEINSHIYEHMQQKKGSSEAESLLAVLEGLGEPAGALKEIVAVRKIDQALKTFRLRHLLQALLLNLQNGVVYVILSLFTLVLACFPILIVLKILFPADTGYFVGNGRHDFGFIRGEKGEEVLGFWFIPLMVAACALLYFAIILVLKLVRKKQKS